MPVNTGIADTKSKDGHKVANTLKLLRNKANGKTLIIDYTRKDGVPRKFETANIIEIKDTAVTIQTTSLEFKRLLIENILKIEEKKETKDERKKL
jgi:hypothetical protein